jgi:flagellar motor switch protein FliM
LLFCSEPTELEFYVAFRPSILYPILDTMMGATEIEPIPQRPMTEVERGLVEVLCEQLMAAYEDAWRPVLALRLGLDRLEHNVQQNPFLSGGEVIYRVRYDVRLGHQTGTIELCLPWQASKQLRQQLDAQAGGV